MKADQIRVGMKVTPTQKTVLNDDSLGKSRCWQWAQKRKQNYLYVNIIYSHMELGLVFVLCDVPNDGMIGDYFYAEDFEPYKGA